MIKTGAKSTKAAENNLKSAALTGAVGVITKLQSFTKNLKK